MSAAQGTARAQGLLALARAAHALATRLAVLEGRLERDDETAWAAYVATAKALAAVIAQLTPGAHGELLTTRQLAERLQITPQTLLRRKAQGQVVPAVQLGRRGRAAIRWAGDEALRGNGHGNG